MSTAIIDSDSFIYRASLTCDELVDIGNGKYQQIYSIDKARNYLIEFINKVKDKTKCDDYVFVTGGIGTNFRYLVNPSYKSNRKASKKPIMLDLVRDMCFKEFKMAYIYSLEADDTCRILIEKNIDNVLVSIDKDLRTFESKIYNPDKGTLTYISKEQADRNFKRQLIIGDVTDGYTGIPKVGIKTANKILDEGVEIEDIVNKYLEAGLTTFDFELVYNSARILSTADYNNGLIKLYGGKILDVRNK